MFQVKSNLRIKIKKGSNRDMEKNSYEFAHKPVSHGLRLQDFSFPFVFNILIE